ncbi:MAG: HlyD family efflux transporter periplasmic adaptor subunit [Lachnospiraceae bacterium]
MGEKLKHLKKKKALKIGAGIIGVLIIILVAGIVIYGKNSENAQDKTAVQTAEVRTGNISTTVVGTGTLESAQTTDVVIPVGIKIEKVLVENGEKVSKGQKLATVNEASVAEKLLEVNENIDSIEDEIDDLSSDASVSGTTENLKSKVLNGQLEDLKEAQDKLEKLLDKKVITASGAGTICGVYVSADTEVERTSESTGSTGSTGQGSDSSNISASADSLTEETADEVLAKVSVGTEEKKESNLLFLNTDSTESDSDAGTAATTIKECSIDIVAPVAGNKPQTEIGESEYFTGTISWNCATDTFLEDTVYIATIKLTAKEGYVFSKNIMPEIKGADVTSEVLEGDNGDSILKIKAQFAKTAKVSGTNASGNSDSKQSSESGSQSTNNTSQNNVADSSAKSAAKTSGGSVSANASAGGGGSSSSGSSQGTSASGSSSSDYSIYETAAFSVASEDKVAISINVDEMDIISVKEGQSATITLDALEDEQFEGEITDVSSVASTSSSSVKYPVKIVMEKTENMLLGMSASATICVEEVENALWIPVNALQERGNHSFVYTEKDSDGNLSGEVEVEIGLSNESQVEITSGLEEGDTVYYLKTGSSENEANWMGGHGSGMPGGDFQKGTMPSGEGKPAGGGNRQSGQKSGDES